MLCELLITHVVEPCLVPIMRVRLQHLCHTFHEILRRADVCAITHLQFG